MIERDMKAFSEMMGMFYILMAEVVAWVYLFVKTN